MEEKDLYFDVVDKDGAERKAELITFLEVEGYTSRYIVYRYAEELEKNGSVVVEVSVCDEVDGKMVLKSIESDDEWAKVKDKMREIILAE